MTPNTRVRPALAVVLVACVVVAFYASFYALPRGWHPCHEDLAAEHPQVDFDYDYDVDRETLTVVHDGGDVVDAGNTLSLVVRFVDGETGARRRVVWTNETVGGPVGPGDELTLSWAALPGETVSDGDRVRVVWRGRTAETPPVCPTRYDVESAVLWQADVEST